MNGWSKYNNCEKLLLKQAKEHEIFGDTVFVSMH